MNPDGWMPLSALALLVDPCWCIEPVWGMKAKRLLDRIDCGAHRMEPAARSPGIPRGDDATGDFFPDVPVDREEIPPYQKRDGVAIVTLEGPMTKRPPPWGGGAATVQVRRAVRQAVSDPAVQGIFLLVDSPGGQVSGTGDLADEVARASRVKPVLAYAEDMCCSAAYWVASQAGAGLYAGPSTSLGSIGTILMMEDTSRASAEAGVRVHVIATGKWKGVGAGGAPLTGEHLDYLHDFVQAINRSFAAAVQAGRRMTPAQMKTLLEAGLYVGQDAVRMGLCDGLCTRDQALAQLRALLPASAAPAAATIPKVGAAGRATTVDLTPPHNEPAPAGTGDAPMKNPIVRALSLLGLSRMALAVVAADTEDPEAIAQAMSEQVKAEVEERISAHPMLLACASAGLATAADLASRLDLAAYGGKAIEDLRSDAKAQAIRAYGAERGQRISAAVHALPPCEVEALRGGWSAEADARYGIGPNGEAASRKTAPSHLPEAVPADGHADARPNAPWEQLSAEARRMGEQLGMNTPQKRDVFAEQVLKAN